MRRPRHAMKIRTPAGGLVALVALALAAAAAAMLLALVLALLAMGAVVALVAGSAWLGWRLLHGPREARRDRGHGAIPTDEVRGLLRIAATPAPMEQYLLAVEEFERISGVAIALTPEQAGSRRTGRRAVALADQAYNLHDAVSGIERRLVNDPYAGGVRAHIWELALASREAAEYLTDLAEVRRTLSLGTLRGLVCRRTALASRRAALLERLESADVTRTLEPAGR